MVEASEKVGVSGDRGERRRAVVVRWETTSETNNAGFYVETQTVGVQSSNTWTERAFAP